MPCRAASGFPARLDCLRVRWTQMILGASCCAKCFTARIHSRNKNMLLVGWKTYCILEYSKCLFAHSIFLVAKALSLWVSTLKKMKTNKNNTHFQFRLGPSFFLQEIRDGPRCEKKTRVFFVVFVGGMCDDWMIRSALATWNIWVFPKIEVPPK